MHKSRERQPIRDNNNDRNYRNDIGEDKITEMLKMKEMIEMKKEISNSRIKTLGKTGYRVLRIKREFWFYHNNTATCLTERYIHPSNISNNSTLYCWQCFKERINRPLFKGLHHVRGTEGINIFSIQTPFTGGAFKSLIG
ncbi:hypothetical protein ACTA71_006150 [Dictyostelium dimigraforme]